MVNKIYTEFYFAFWNFRDIFYFKIILMDFLSYFFYIQFCFQVVSKGNFIQFKNVRSIKAPFIQETFI